MQLHKLHKYASELEQSGGRRGRRGWRQPEVGREGEGRLSHGITPLLCHYILEWHSFSMMSEAAQCGQWGQGRSVEHQGARGGIPLQQLGHGPPCEGATCYLSVTTRQT